MPDWLKATGETARRIRTYPWEKTPLGPIDTWPAVLRTALQLVLDSPHPMSLMWGGDLVMLHNDAYLALFPAKTDAIGRPFAEVWPEVEDIIAPQIATALGGRFAQFENVSLEMLQAEDGQGLRSFDYTFSPVRGEDGSVAGVLNAPIETTARVRAEQRRNEADRALRESERRFRALVTASSDAVYRMNRDWTEFRLSGGVGLPAETPPSERDWAETYLLPEDREYILAAVAEAIKKQEVFELEHRMRQPDGSIGWVSSRAVPILEGGEIVEWFGTATDVTARKTMEAALRESEARLSAAFESIPAGVAIVAPNGRFVMANGAYRRFLPNEVIPSKDAERGNRWRAWDEEGREVDPGFYPGARALRGETVIPGMELLYTDDDGRKIWADVAAAPIRDEAGRVTGAASVISDITERKRAAEAIARNENRTAFLLKLTDALRPLDDAAAIRRTACAILAEQLGADWVHYVDYSVEAGFGVVDDDYAAPGLPGLAGRYRADEFRKSRNQMSAGRTWVVRNAAAETVFAEGEREKFFAREVMAWVNVPLARGDTIEAILCVVEATPREWSEEEVGLVEETAERLWSSVRRTRAEAALRESERRLQNLVEGVPQLVWRADSQGHWTWASPQWEAETGLSMGGSLGLGWLAAIHPNDQSAFRHAWKAAAIAGQLELEGRIFSRPAGRHRWFQTRAKPVRDEGGAIIEWLGTSTDIDDLRELRSRQDVLVAELQHRTRNLITVVKALARQTLGTAGTLEDFERRFNNRLGALSRVQGLLSHLSAGERVSFDELLHSELAALGAPEAKVTLEGPAGVEIRSAAVQTFSLALHELATNALKYGALAIEGGHLRVGWTVIQVGGGNRRLLIDWKESGLDMTGDDRRPGQGGYGRELIERALPYQLDATTSFAFESDGVHCTIDVAVPAAAQ